MQIVGSDELAVGSPILLQLNDGVAVVGTTEWSSAQESKFAAGVAFINAASGRQFYQAVTKV